MRVIVPIKKAAPYIGSRSVTAVYTLIQKDPAFAVMWFKIQGRTVAFEDQLIRYAEERERTARLFTPAEPPKRKRGRPAREPPVAAEQSGI